MAKRVTMIVSLIVGVVAAAILAGFMALGRESATSLLLTPIVP